MTELYASRILSRLYRARSDLQFRGPVSLSLVSPHRESFFFSSFPVYILIEVKFSFHNAKVLDRKNTHCTPTADTHAVIQTWPSTWILARTP